MQTRPDAQQPKDGSASRGVELAGGRSATAHLHAALIAAVTAHPEVFESVEVPDDSSTFRATYAEVLPRFEAARADSDRRADIARTIVRAARDAMGFGGDAMSLSDAVTAPAEPRAVETWRPNGSSRLHPRVPFGGRVLGGEDLRAEIDAMVARGSASPGVADAVSGVIEAARPGGIDLRGRRIAMFGAGAELAPTRLWLEGGADVLWIDLADPPAELLDRDDLAGSLSWIPGGINVLEQPHTVRATVETFAGDDQVDLGLYAYAPGQAREWRLTATMNAIVDGLPPGMARGVAMLLSPTTCGVVTPEELKVEAKLRAERPRWQDVLDGLRAFGRGDGHVTSGSTAVNRAVVTIQGGSYQAAQYVGKLLTAEVWATRDPPLAVSANTAGISLTESLHHPVFDTAFAGARSLGVETFEPATTAALNGLLTLHDRLDPDATRRPIEELFTTRVHGGLYTVPYPIDPALRVAAAIGILKDPRRLRGLLTR